MSNKLEDARKIINRVDAEMAKLFEERMAAAEIIAEYKMERGLPILDEAREAEIIRRSESLVESDKVRPHYITFLRNTMATSRAYQSEIMEGMRVAYSGTEGAFAHIATCKLYPSARKVAFSTFSAAYNAVVDGECEVALLPIENSFNGEVGQVTDLMFQGTLHLTGILDLAVTQDLLVLPGTKIEEIEEVISHPQALGQCADFIEAHGFKASEHSNTALAAKYVKEKGNPKIAAIASAEAAEIFGLEVLQKNINSARNNTTRFAVFSRTRAARTPKDRGVHTVIVFTVRHEAGALADAISIIGKHGFNMQSLRSRPMKELLWQYYFYVEAEGNIDSEEGEAMIAELSPYCDKLKIVGTYIKD